MEGVRWLLIAPTSPNGFLLLLLPLLLPNSSIASNLIVKKQSYNSLATDEPPDEIQHPIQQGNLMAILTIQSQDQCSGSTGMCSLSIPTLPRLSRSLPRETSFCAAWKARLADEGLSNDAALP